MAMSELLPGTEVHARGLRWEIVFSQQIGPQTLFRLRGLEGAALGRKLDLLHPFEFVEPVIRELRPERAAPLRNWRRRPGWTRLRGSGIRIGMYR